MFSREKEIVSIKLFNLSNILIHRLNLKLRKNYDLASRINSKTVIRLVELSFSKNIKETPCYCPKPFFSLRSSFLPTLLLNIWTFSNLYRPRSSDQIQFPFSNYLCRKFYNNRKYSMYSTWKFNERNNKIIQCTILIINILNIKHSLWYNISNIFYNPIFYIFSCSIRTHIHTYESVN